MTHETEPQILLAATGVEEALGRLADAIVAGGSVTDLLLVGIRRRGVELA
jgi:pyrimidine operon attenuation protein/uracil phosphoribosyltransferase